MKRELYLLGIILSVLLIGACATLRSDVSITCPPTQNVIISSAPQDAGTLHLPAPVLSGDCEDGGISFNLVSGQVQEGANTLTYEATDNCNNKESCTFTVNAKVDYRQKFVGTYVGYRDCSALNTTQTHPDQNMSVTVSLGAADNQLKIGSDQVMIDSTGSFPYPFFGSYRSYSNTFRNDSLFLFQQWGIINVNETCNFSGKKQ